MPNAMTTADELFAECLLPALRLSEEIAAFPPGPFADDAWRLAAFEAVEDLADKAASAASGAMRHMGIAVEASVREAVCKAFALSGAEWEGWHPHPLAVLLVSTARDLERASSAVLGGGSASMDRIADDLFEGTAATLEAYGRKAIRTESGVEVA